MSFLVSYFLKRLQNTLDFTIEFSDRECGSFKVTYFNLSLTSITGVVLQYLNSDDFVGSLLPAFDDLSEGAPAKELQDFILVGHAVEDLVLHQLVVSVGPARR